MNFKNLFQNFCKKNNLEINSNQLVIVDELESFYKLNFDKSILQQSFVSPKDYKTP